MKSPYESRIFCSIVSLACAWFLFIDWRDNHKINILNLLWFLGTTYLALHTKKEEQLDTDKIDNSQSDNVHTKSKKSVDLDDVNELQLTHTFKKQNFNKEA